MITTMTICARCGAVLAHDHVGAALCTPCAAAEPQAATRRLDSDALAYLIGSLLLCELAYHPGRPVYVQRVLECMDIVATTIEIRCAVNKLRRRDWDVRAEERHPGYFLLGMKKPMRTWSRRPRQTALR